MSGLIMRQGPSPGVHFQIGDQLILGRHRNADVVVQDIGASRRHAAVISRAGSFRLVDLGSRNGTFLNGEPVREETALSDGDLIRIGTEVYEFVLEDPASAAGPATATLETASLVDRPSGRGRGDDGRSPGRSPFPRELGKFMLLAHLGRGGMGDVFRARERDGGPELALKVIRSDIGNRESFLDYFHNREAVLALEIDHPNIIRILDHGMTGNQHFIAMEYVDGESLQDRLRRGPLPFEESLEILRQVACGLAAAHRQGVVHSDIKPGNILILRDFPSRPGGASEASPPAGNGAGSEARGGVELEFPEAEGRRSQPARKYDGALQEEIRKRLGDPPQDLLLDPPYHPRPSEMRFLLHYWENLRESGGYLLLVEGEPGAGKDRLLSELIKDLGLAASVPGAFLPPPAKLHELDASRIEGIPLLHQKLHPDRAPIDHPTRESVDEILRALAADPEPAVVRVLAIEHASPIACELLSGLMRLLPRRPILVLASLDAGSLERNFALRQLLRAEGARVKSLYLRPLSEYQIGRYLQELFREPLRQDRLAADLHRLTRGNPARLLETLRGFLQRGILKVDRPAGGIIYQPSNKELELEEGKQFYEKYRSYGKMEQKVLEDAAFIGPEFLFDTLLRFSEIDETALFFIVRDLNNQGFITEPSRTWYRFSNEAFRRYIAERVSPRERPRLHRKVGWLLDESPRPPSAELHWLRAYHWERAGEHGKAVRLLLEGAHLARSEYDIDRARQMYQEVLRIYRSLASDESARKSVTDELKSRFQRDANWYEVLGGLGEEPVEPQVKITDFGISFRIREEDEDGLRIEQHVPLGTPRYLAPERVGREPGGPKSDIFALGILAYEMLAGEAPFPGKRGIDVMRANLNDAIPDPPLPAGAPAEFRDLWHGMVEKDQDLRWDAERVLRTIEKMQFDLRMKGPPA
jgi:serine/threonine protein kinase